MTAQHTTGPWIAERDAKAAVAAIANGAGNMINYNLLKAYGFSAYKALEIVISVGRGDAYAIQVCEIAKAAKAVA